MGDRVLQSKEIIVKNMSALYVVEDDAFIVVAAPVQKNGIIEGVVYFQCDTYILQSIVEGVNGLCIDFGYGWLEHSCKP